MVNLKIGAYLVIIQGLIPLIQDKGCVFQNRFPGKAVCLIQNNLCMERGIYELCCSIVADRNCGSVVCACDRYRNRSGVGNIIVRRSRLNNLEFTLIRLCEVQIPRLCIFIRTLHCILLCYRIAVYSVMRAVHEIRSVPFPDRKGCVAGNGASREYIGLINLDLNVPGFVYEFVVTVVDRGNDLVLLCLVQLKIVCVVTSGIVIVGSLFLHHSE